MDRPGADSIFQSALDLPASEREAHCREMCGDDEELLAEVLELLALDPGTHGMPFGDAPMRVGPAERQITDPERIGPFRILQRLGAGGFGVVYEAEQQSPVRRRIALKVLKAGMDTEEVLARFDAERQALALMNHPNIARVLDVGATDQGRPWFAMELVRGESIIRYADHERLSVAERIDLFLQVCNAVQHAHQKGIIHRDLKPGNLLVTRVDGVVTPKVIDFGIAKAVHTPLIDRTLHTRGGAVMGTPVYMSPEQAGSSRIDVDTSTDVYSLGVVLYELLCGYPPIDPELLASSSPAEYGERIRSTRKRPPSERLREVDDTTKQVAAGRGTDPWSLRTVLRADLDWITMRAIAVDRERRYQTVQELAQELRRYQSNLPVLAGPPSVRYRLRKFVRRHRVEFGVALVILFVLLGAGAGLTWSLVESNRQRAIAEHALLSAESARAEAEVVTEFLTEMLAAPRPLAEGRDVTVAEVLDQATAGRGLELPGQPTVEARLRQVIGSTYRELGRGDEARQQLETALALQRAELGPDHPSTLETLRSLGLLHRDLGDYEKAAAQLGEAVEGFRRLDPPAPRLLARALECLGSTYVLDEDPSTGLPILEEAFALAEVHLSPEDEVYHEICSDIGLALVDLGEYERAEPYVLRAYEFDVDRWGAEDVRTMGSAQNLSAFYRETGRAELALPIYRQTWTTSADFFGAEHPFTVRCRNNLALALSDVGEYDEGLEHALAVVEVRERDLGPDANPTLASRINLALLYHRRGEEQRAEAHIRVTIERCRLSQGKDHLYTLISESLLGEILVTEGRAAEARPLLESTVRRFSEARGADYWRTAHTRVTLGQCLLDLGDLDGARAQLVPARAALAEQFPVDHHRVVRADAQLARLALADG